MSFVLLHPAIALAGLAAAAIPIILHLLLRQKPKQLEFPALRLLQRRSKQTTRKLRLQNLLLMLLRILLLVFLALALSRPTVKSDYLSFDQAAPGAAMFVVDTSLSMAYQQDGKTRLDVAKESAIEIAGDLPEGSELTVIDSSSPVTNVPLDLPGAVASIRKLEVSGTYRPLNEALTVAIKALGRATRDRREIYILTDRAAHAWLLDQAEQIQTLIDTLIDGSVQIYVIDVGTEERSNLMVGLPEISQAQLYPKGKLNLRVPIRNTGATAVERAFSLELDGTNRENKQVAIPAGEEIIVDLSVPGLTKGYHQGRLRLTSGDSLTEDDDRYFTIHVREPIQVLVISDVAEEARQWTTALVPQQLRQQGAGRYVLKEIRTKELADADLSEINVVTMLDVSTLSREEWVKLSNFVQAGGSLFVGLGPRVAAGSYNSESARLVMPAQLVKVEQPPPEADTLFLAPDRYEHPVLEKFRQSQASELPTLPVYRYWEVKPAEAATTVIKYSNGQPALLERTFGVGSRGRVMLLTTAAHYLPDQELWSELPRGWSYLVLVHEATQYLAGSADIRLNYPLGSNVAVPLDPDAPFVQFIISDPEGVVEPRTVAARDTALLLPMVRKAGNWTIKASAQGQTMHAGFSVNAPVEESQLAAVDPAQLKQLLGEDRTTIAAAGSDFERNLDDARVGRELFPWIMLLVLTVLVAEGYLSNRYYREPVAA